jgi:hypothetical protein
MAQHTDSTQGDAPESAKVFMRLPCDAGRFTLWLEEFVRHEGEKNVSPASMPSLSLFVVEDRQKLEIALRRPGDSDLPAPGLHVRDEFRGFVYSMLVTIIEVTLVEVDRGLDVIITSFLPGRLRGLAERLVQRATKELAEELPLADEPAKPDRPKWFPSSQSRQQLWRQKADLMGKMDKEYQEDYERGDTDNSVPTYKDYRGRIVARLHDTHNGDDTLRNIRIARQKCYDSDEIGESA